MKIMSLMGLLLVQAILFSANVKAEPVENDLKLLNTLNGAGEKAGSNAETCQSVIAPKAVESGGKWKSAYVCLKSFIKYRGIPSNVPWGVDGPLVISANPEEEVVVFAMAGGAKKKIRLFSSSEPNLSSEKSDILTNLRNTRFQMTGPTSTPSVLTKEQFDWIRAQNLSIGEIVTVKIDFKTRNFILDGDKIQSITMPDVNIGESPVFKVELNGKLSYVKPDEMGFLLSRAWDENKNPYDVGIKPKQAQVSTSAGPFPQWKFTETSKKMTSYPKISGEPVVKVVGAKEGDEMQVLKELNKLLKSSAENLYYQARDSRLPSEELKKQANFYLSLLNSDLCKNELVSQDSFSEARENLIDLAK